MNAGNIAKIVNAYAAAIAAAKGAADEVSRLKTKLIELGAGTYEGTSHKVVISESQPIRFDTQSFREVHPALWKEFQKPGDIVTSVRIYGR